MRWSVRNIASLSYPLSAPDARAVRPYVRVDSRCSKKLAEDGSRARSALTTKECASLLCLKSCLEGSQLIVGKGDYFDAVIFINCKLIVVDNEYCLIGKPIRPVICTETGIIPIEDIQGASDNIAQFLHVLGLTMSGELSWSHNSFKKTMRFMGRLLCKIRNLKFLT